MIKNIFAGLLALTLLQGSNNIGEQVSVPTGRVKYAQNASLASFGFAGCSAIILDHENSAVMAHALPGEYQAIGQAVNSSNAVKYLLEELARNNINPSSTEAIISAGSEGDLQKIINQLEDSGIAVGRKQVDDFGKVGWRDVKYDPVINKLDITYHKI